MRWTLSPIADFPARAWDSLNRRLGGCPLLAADTVEPLLRHFATGKERLAVLDGGAAMAIVAPAGRLAWRTWQPDNAPLGLWLAPPGVSPAGLLPALPGFPLLFSVTRQDPALAARPGDGGALRSMDHIVTARWTLPVDHGLSRNLRGNLRRQHNRLRREGRTPRLEIVTDPAAVPAAVADYARLEASGWKGARGSAVVWGTPQARFYVDSLQRFAARGETMIFRYHCGDELAASLLGLVWNEALIILKLAYDERLAAASPGLLMVDAMLNHLAATPLRVVELYGQATWARRWPVELRTIYHLNLYRWPLLAALHRPG